MNARRPLTNAPGRWPANRIREARLAAGLSQAVLGARVGLDGSSVHRLETGSRELTWAAAERLARGLAVAPGELFVPPRRYSPVVQELAERLAALPSRDRDACLLLARALAADTGNPIDT